MIGNIYSLLDRSGQYRCNDVLFDGSLSYFNSEIQLPTSKKYENNN